MYTPAGTPYHGNVTLEDLKRIYDRKNMTYEPGKYLRTFRLTTGPSIADPAWQIAGAELFDEPKETLTGQVSSFVGFTSAMPIIQAAVETEYARGLYEGETEGRTETLKTLGIDYKTYDEIRRLKADGSVVSIYMTVADAPEVIFTEDEAFLGEAPPPRPETPCPELDEGDPID